MTRQLLQILLIVALTGLFYAPSLRNDFIWDDDDYVHDNVAVQSPDGLTAIWLSAEMPQYYPVVFTSFWLEHRLWGSDPFGYHAVNLALHIGNAVLLYLLMLRLYPPLAFAVALLFALNPVQVETVAWVTERKNLLGCLFYLAATGFWLTYDETRRRRHYAAALGAFVLALLSKSITVSFVMIPLFLRWWRGERIGRADLVALLPFFAVGLACGLNTVWLEMHRVGAQGAAWTLSFAEHLILPGQIILFYLGKILFPVELVFFYPKWQLDAGNPVQWLPLAVVLTLGAALYAARGRIGRGAFANALYAVCALFPALGFFNVYPMLFSYVADHFQYIASINLIILMAGAGAFLFDRAMALGKRQVGPAVRRTVLSAVLGVMTVLYGWQIVRHSRHFADLEALWTHVIANNERSWIAHNNLGLVYRGQGKIEAAIREFRKTVEIVPENIQARTNLGIYYYAFGRHEEALAEFEQVLKIDANYAHAYNNIGLVHLNAGRDELAREFFATAIAKDPRLFQAHYNLAEYYLGAGQREAAVTELHTAIRLFPEYFDAMHLLAGIYQQAGEADAALRWVRQALAVNPEFSPAHARLGTLLAGQGALREAIAEFQLALQGDPGLTEALVNAGRAHLLLGEPEQAIPYLRRARDGGAALPPEVEALLARGTAGEGRRPR